jgi:hydroxymethylglutaryl-CoA lyase
VSAGVRVVEVGPRDGLQNEKDIVPVETKIAFVNALSHSGLRDVEITSFVSPKAIPQLADAAEVIRGIEKVDGNRYSVLIPNIRGLERWVECLEFIPPAARSIAFFTAASETFNQKNTNASIDDSLDNFRDIAARVRSELGQEMPFIRAYVSTAFVCPYEGPISPEAVARISRALVEMGANEISLGDTIGAASPRQVEELLDVILPIVPRDELAMHFHDTRGTALANVLKATEMGISVFDSSASGLGGCPFAPGAAGNVATEDLLYMLHGMGIETGVDLSKVVAASEIIRPAIGHLLPSKELQAFTSAGF